VDKTFQALITRLPYAQRYSVTELMPLIQKVDLRGLICISMPIHVEYPSNGVRFICDLEASGLTLCAVTAWYRDRHIVTSKSRRLTNTWEPVAIFSRSPQYILNRETATKVKKGYENRENVYSEDEFETCIGDHWPVRNDRRDRRFLPAGIVMNCGQLADLHPGDCVVDPYGNPGVRDACQLLGWNYVDGALESGFRKENEDGEEEVVLRKGKRNPRQDQTGDL
jgi:hypothetical protein